MKRLAPFLLALAPALALAEPTTWNIDPSHTQSTFAVRHLVISTVRGEFKKTTGTVKIDEQNPASSAVDVTIDATTVHTREDKRDEHLRSPDFFNAKEFPQLTFKSTKVERTGETSGKLHGDLTLLGVTKPVVLDVTFNKEGVSPASKKVTAGFSARGTIKRSDFGMKYGVPNIGDEITLLIEAEAVKS